jgi:hypothetical protein
VCVTLLRQFLFSGVTLLALATRDKELIVMPVDTQAKTVGAESKAMRGGVLACCWHPEESYVVVWPWIESVCQY